MLLSIIIVSYNARYFLEQCLCSVERAMNGKSAIEVFVVDNNSPDKTIEYLGPKFPSVRFIPNAENVGFGRANNQALHEAKGQYILFLNPDTIVPEDVFSLCTDFMNSHVDAGALGIRMIDGSGQFLRESKRGFPSPWASFCKMSGLTGLFPSSKLFAPYYMGHLPENQEHVVDVLPGAFMLVRKDVLERIGGFDEQFFMYAEDIDLSYRIQQAGYKNYYLPTGTIIHFKGESTRKDGRYVNLFYKAMIQFVRKHPIGMTGLYIALLKLVIWVKGGNPKSASDNPDGKHKNPEVGGADFSLTGDEASIKEAKSFLTPTETNSPAAKAVIFCEGPNYTFKKIITQFQELSPGQKAFVHGSGTSSIVSSSSKDRQGEVMLHFYLKNG